MTSPKFTFSLRRRKTLNNWAITNRYFTEIPLRFSRKWLYDNGYADKNAFYEHLEEGKNQKAKDDRAAKYKIQNTKYRKIRHYQKLANSIIKLHEFRQSNMEWFSSEYEPSIKGIVKNYKFSFSIDMSFDQIRRHYELNSFDQDDVRFHEGIRNLPKTDFNSINNS